MQLSLKIAAGAASVGLIAALGLAFGPQVKPDKVSAKALVEQPVFVVASAQSKPVAPPPSKAALIAAEPARVSTTPTQTTVVAAASAPPASPRGISAASPEASAACSQGLVALAKGDLAAARQWLARAADLGDVRALLALGDAYNPAMLTRLGVVGATGDAARARDYYGRALNSGFAQARDRLATLASAAD